MNKQNQESPSQPTISPRLISVPTLKPSPPRPKAGSVAPVAETGGELSRGTGILETCQAGPKPINPADIVIGMPVEPLVQTPLRKYSLINSVAELEKEAQEQTPLLDQLCLKGQATVWYAKPNSGKTLIALHLLRNAIAEERIKGGDAYYVDADDTSSGVLEKLRILAEQHVHVLAPGFRDFEAKRLPGLLEEMISDGTAKGSFVILDTMKKFVSLMDKRESSGFADIARRFVMRGGTLLGLAHTNKRAGPDGKPIFAGTSDILDDFDCGYMISEVPQSSGAAHRVVQFDNLKRRGNVASIAAYRYALDADTTYADLLASVSQVGADELTAVRTGVEFDRERPVIEAISAEINGGANVGKMVIVDKVCARLNRSRKAVTDILEKFTGERDESLWYFNRGDRGVQAYGVYDEYSERREDRRARLAG
jgi:hypothetical protein